MEKIAVIGSGAMGNGIAHTFAMYGYQVTMIDSSKQALENGFTTISRNLDRMVQKGKITQQEKEETLNRIIKGDSIQQGITDADLIIEAATEKIDVKLDIFRQLDAYAKPNCILASNTSSISITKIASVTRRPHKVIGMHFMNPVPIMKLVEVIRGYSTSNEVTSTVMEIGKKIGKQSVEVNDYPGFVANRILMPMINESIFTLYEGVAGVEEIDTVMKLGMAHPMGPLQLADFIGLDVCLSIMEVLHEGLGQPKYAPCPLLINMVTAGHLGMKSGKGFYSYESGNKELVLSERFQKKQTQSSSLIK